VAQSARNRLAQLAPAGCAIGDGATPEELDLLEDHVLAETRAAAGVGPDEELAVMVRDGSGRVVAGISGWTWGGCAELAHMWVDPQVRNRGLGSALMAAAEEEAVHRGCDLVVLLTHDVQAAGYYERLGYETVAVVSGYPRGSAARWFRKQLGHGGARDAPGSG